MGHRAYISGGTDQFGNEKKRPAFAKKAFRARSPQDIGGAAHRAAVREGTPVNTLSIPSAMSPTVAYQAATGEEVRKAFGVVLHHVPLKTETVKPKPVKARTTKAKAVVTPRPAVDVRLNREDSVKRCPFTTEPVNVCYCGSH